MNKEYMKKIDERIKDKRGAIAKYEELIKSAEDTCQRTATQYGHWIEKEEMDLTALLSQKAAVEAALKEEYNN